MTAPVLVSGGGSTTNRKWVLEVNISGSALAPNWQALEFMQNFTPNSDEANWQDSTTYGDGGYTSQAKTAAAWSATATVLRKTLPTNPTQYGPVQEYLRSKAIGIFGAGNQVQVRYFEFDTNDPNGVASPRSEAYMGYVGVQWAEQGGTQEGISQVAVTLQSQSKLSLVAHPYPLAAAAPTVTSASPTAVSVAGGQIVHIVGSGFTGTVATTGVKFGGTNATAFTVDNDHLIIAVTPAKTAGAAQVVVTNATGASTSAVNVTYA